MINAMVTLFAYRRQSMQVGPTAMKSFSWFWSIAVATFALFAAVSGMSAVGPSAVSDDTAQVAAPAPVPASRGTAPAGSETADVGLVASFWSALPELPAAPKLSDAAASSGTHGGDGLDIVSLVAGIIIGIGFSAASRVSWFEMPRRAVRWVIANERNFYRFGMAAACLGVLLFY